MTNIIGDPADLVLKFQVGKPSFRDRRFAISRAKQLADEDACSVGISVVIYRQSDAVLKALCDQRTINVIVRAAPSVIAA